MPVNYRIKTFGSAGNRRIAQAWAGSASWQLLRYQREYGSGSAVLRKGARRLAWRKQQQTGASASARI